MRNCFRAGNPGMALVFALLVFATPLFAQQPDGYSQVVGLIHMDSSISGGKNTPEKLAAAAKNAGAGFGVLTDHDTQKVTYGLPPLRDVLKVSYSRGSIRTYGISRYLRDVAEINRTRKNFVFLPGIEAVPYYHWEKGRDGRLKLQDLHRHILVMGLETPAQLGNLPSIEAGYPSRYTRESLLGLFWLAPALAGLFVLTRSRGEARFGKGFASVIRSGPARATAIPVFAFSLLMLVNAYPFRSRPVDQYQSDLRSIPYQSLIDYVNSQGGLTFWAHPEAHFRETVSAASGNGPVSLLLKTFLDGGLTLETEPCHALLNETRDYTGFAIFFEGCRVVGKPGGLWDDLLMQFCTGTRNRPVWAIAELDMDSGISPEQASESQTMLLVRGKSRGDYLDALRNGRMYCFTGNITRTLNISDYSAVSGDVRAVSGEVLPCGEDARLILDFHRSGVPSGLECIVVRDGTVLRRELFTDSKRFEIPLTPPEGEMGYVRAVVMRSGEMVAATNPIFLERAGKP